MFKRFSNDFTLYFSIIMFSIINGFALCNLFLHEITLYFLLIIGVIPVGLCYIWSVICSIFTKCKNRKKAILINLLTPLILAFILALNLPVVFNFCVLYPFRKSIVMLSSIIDQSDSVDIFVGNVLCPNGLEIYDCKTYESIDFNLREEFLMSNDFPDNVEVIAAHSQIEYSSNGFNDAPPENTIFFGYRWRYTSYDRYQY